MKEEKAKNLLDYLAGIPDPRSRQGRRYRLSSLLACLILAALNGQNSLRGMWLWAKEHSSLLIQPLFWDTGRIPALDTFWSLLRRLDVEALLQAVNKWLRARPEAEEISLDEKMLRGSKREGEGALEVLTAMGQRMGKVLAQVEVKGGDVTEAALKLLEQIPVEGKLVSVDAGLMKRPIIKEVVKKGGLSRVNKGESA